MVYDVFIRMLVFLVLGRNNTVEDSVFLSVFFLCFLGDEQVNLYADVITIWLK